MAALQRSPAPQPTPAWRRLAGRAALAFGGLLLAEIVAWAAGAILLGRVDWRVATAGERELAGRAVEAAAPASSTDPTPALRGSEIVLHPYLGYVTDPAINRRSERRDALRVRNDGFFATQDELLPRSPGQVDVAIFGGSVAFLLCFEGHDALLRALARAPQFAGRRLALHCRALGGFKQPQPLLALAYLATLGERYDLVIEIDGFNELALPWAENRARGVNPFYPRSWDATVGDIASPARQSALAALVAERHRRRAIAHAFSLAPLRRDPLSQLLWLVLDRRSAARVGKAQQRVLTAPASPGFLARGPAFPTAGRRRYLAALTRHWVRCSREMKVLANALGARYYQVLQPNQYVAGSKPMGEEERRRAVLPGHPYGVAVALGYRGLASAGQELAGEGVRFLDARFVFQRVSEPLYVDDCCHFNARGSERFGKWIGERIVADLAAQGEPAEFRAAAMRRARTAAP